MNKNAFSVLRSILFGGSKFRKNQPNQFSRILHFTFFMLNQKKKRCIRPTKCDPACIALTHQYIPCHY